MVREVACAVRSDRLDELLDADWGDDPVALRDRAICELLYGAGIRVSELCSLDVDDLHDEGGVIEVTGKGSKERMVPLHEMAVNRAIAGVGGATTN